MWRSFFTMAAAYCCFFKESNHIIFYFNILKMIYINEKLLVIKFFSLLLKYHVRKTRTASLSLLWFGLPQNQVTVGLMSLSDFMGLETEQWPHRQVVYLLFISSSLSNKVLLLPRLSRRWATMHATQLHVTYGRHFVWPTDLEKEPKGVNKNVSESRGCSHSRLRWHPVTDTVKVIPSAHNTIGSW